jgi:hypothetical protein
MSNNAISKIRICCLSETVAELAAGARSSTLAARMRLLSGATLTGLGLACGAQSAPSAPNVGSPPPLATPTAAERGAETPPAGAIPPLAPGPARDAAQGAVLAPAAATCEPFDWSPRKLPPLLKPGKTPNSAYPDRPATTVEAFDDECTGAPDGPRAGSASTLLIDGVELRLTSATPAGSTGRPWAGNQCTLELRLADGAGQRVALGPELVPPFNSVSSLVRVGSAVWLVFSFNGYTREFPKGGNRILALDLCAGRVAWKSKDGRANSSVLLLGDYLVSSFGFTSERRFVYVQDARSGAVIQQLGVVENVCPSKSWAPNWDGGRCDAPGQSVGAAYQPRIEGGLFLVDTNTGSSAFELK